MKYLVFLILIFFASPLIAVDNTTAKNVGNFNDWRAFVWDLQEGRKVCSVLSFPKKEEGKYTRRGEVLVQVTIKGSASGSGIVNFKAGYPIKKSSKIKIIIDDKQIAEFDLIQGQMAWAMDEKLDTLLINAMKSGNKMIVSGVSSRGTNTKDTYSLRGFTAAYKKITAACKL